MPIFLSRSFIIPVILFLIFGVAYFFLSPPREFPSGEVISIQKGSSLRSISKGLKDSKIIRSRVAFETFAILYGGEHHMVPGDYLFKSKISVFELAFRITTGEYGMDLVKFTIPEGYDLDEIAKVATPLLHNFNAEDFAQKTINKEGYLFPDTYFLFPATDADQVIKAMSENFSKKIKSLESDILISGKSESDIIVMASIIEREAKGDADRNTISGILWNRIAKGMPLQADAAPETYKNKGLPKSPICNPGLEAIKAAIHPVSSSYLYYIHDKSGTIHYAKTFAEHKINIAKYLK